MRKVEITGWNMIAWLSGVLDRTVVVAVVDPDIHMGGGGGRGGHPDPEIRGRWAPWAPPLDLLLC